MPLITNAAMSTAFRRQASGVTAHGDYRVTIFVMTGKRRSAG